MTLLRFATLALLGALSLVAAGAHAQTAAIPEVCVLHPGDGPAARERLGPNFAAGLRDHRLEAGRDVIVTWHGASYDWARLPALVQACVAANARVIVPISPVVVAAARAATRTIPIVAHDMETDPVEAGLVESLARPGGTLTGIYFDFPEFGAKWLALVTEALPGITRIGLLWDPRTGRARTTEARILATARGLTLVEREMDGLDGLEAQFRGLVEDRVQAVLLLSSPLIGSDPRPFADLALKHRLPAITMFPSFADAGGLMAYGPDLIETYRPLGDLVGKVLRGANPATLPVDRPSRMRLVVNLATAKALGVTLPPAVLARADEVIE